MDIEPLTEMGRDGKGTKVCRGIRNPVLHTCYLDDVYQTYPNGDGYSVGSYIYIRVWCLETVEAGVITQELAEYGL